MICQDVSESLQGYKDVSQWYLVVHDKMARILKVGVVLLISKWYFAASDLRHINPLRFDGQISHVVEIKIITPIYTPSLFKVEVRFSTNTIQQKIEIIDIARHISQINVKICMKYIAFTNHVELLH